jgi:hypothetical protein
MKDEKNKQTNKTIRMREKRRNRKCILKIKATTFPNLFLTKIRFH